MNRKREREKEYMQVVIGHPAPSSFNMRSQEQPGRDKEGKNLTPETLNLLSQQ